MLVQNGNIFSKGQNQWIDRNSWKLPVKKDGDFSPWKITLELLWKTQKQWLQESSSLFKHLPIKFKRFSFGGKIANKIFAKLAFFQKDIIVFWIFMILMDFNVEMKPFKFNICDNACSRWQHSKRLNKWIHGNNQSKKMEIFHHCKKLLNY